MSLKDPNVVNPKRRKRVAIVISNPAISTTTDWPVGFWWSELSHPYFILTERGYEIDVFSPDGGKCEADPAVCRNPRFWHRIPSAYMGRPFHAESDLR